MPQATENKRTANEAKFFSCVLNADSGRYSNASINYPHRTHIINRLFQNVRT